MRKLICALAAVVAIGCSRADAGEIPGGNVARGKDAIESAGCGTCHVIPGLRNARGQVGPPLTGLSRRSVIAGSIPNTGENLIRWLEDPQLLKPGTAMPNLSIDAATARDIAAYLYRLP